MKDKEPRNILGAVRRVCEGLRVDGETSMLARVLYVSFATMPLALVRYPGALIRAAYFIGDRESLKRDRELLKTIPQPGPIRDNAKLI